MIPTTVQELIPLYVPGVGISCKIDPKIIGDAINMVIDSLEYYLANG